MTLGQQSLTWIKARPFSRSDCQRRYLGIDGDISMADGKSAAGARSPATTLHGALDGIAWIQSVSEAQSKMCASMGKEALGLAARRLQTQADFLKNLAECDSPAGFLPCYGEFVQKAFGNLVEDSQRAVGALQDISSASSGKR